MGAMCELPTTCTVPQLLQDKQTRTPLYWDPTPRQQYTSVLVGQLPLVRPRTDTIGQDII